MKKYIILTVLVLSGLIATVKAAPANNLWQDGKIVHAATAMTTEQLNAILNTMRGKANDAEKLTVLKDGLKDKGVTVAQVITLLSQLNEDAKLDGAIYAFQYTTDFKKYDKVQDIFGKDENKHKLQDYVDRHKK
ncbi:MAG: DUF4476 domain-containing protein [Bacteroidota bacterium]